MQETNVRACVCVVLWDVNNLVLTVTRANGDGVGLPGGKVEEGETLVQAARREFWEETGLYIDPHQLIELHKGPCTAPFVTDERFEVTTFLAGQWQGTLQQREACVRLQWLPYTALLNNSPFARYNRTVGEKLIGKFPSFRPHVFPSE